MRRLQQYVIPAGQRGIDNVTALQEGAVFVWAQSMGSAIILWFTVPVDDSPPTRFYVFRVLDRPGLKVGDDWEFLAGVTVGGQPAIVFEVPVPSKLDPLNVTDDRSPEQPGADPFRTPTSLRQR